MGEFVVAFDDSGGIELLCDWNGNFIPGDHPVTVLGAFYIRKPQVDRFKQDWRGLQEQMGLALGVEKPPIHMRLMWGKSRPQKYRGSSNPFLDADYNDVREWVRTAWTIIDTHVRAKSAGWFYSVRVREQAAQSQIRFLKDSHFARERQFLVRHRRRGRSIYEGFHRLITSPLLELYVSALPQLNELMCACRRSTAHVLVDSFNDSHGVDELEVVSALKDIGGLRYIDSVSRIENGDKEPLLQAADLIAFSMRRFETAELGFMQPDRDLLGIAENMKGQSVTRADIPRLAERRFPNLGQIVLTLHYSLARAHAHRFDSYFTERNLVPVQEFFQRAARAGDSDTVGVSVLTEEAQNAAHGKH